MENKKNVRGKRLDFLGVIILIGAVPLLTAMLILTVAAASKMETELEDSTYARLKACAISVQKYFEWDVREDILAKDDVSYGFIDSLNEDGIVLTFFQDDVRFITSVTDENGKRMEGTKADPSIWNLVKAGNDYQADQNHLRGFESDHSGESGGSFPYRRENKTA